MLPNQDREAPKSARILYVDDDSLQVMLGQRALEAVGHFVDTQTNPLQALAAVGQDPDKYDLIVTDQRMPEMIGEVLAGKIREIRPDMPIILVTGDAATLANTEKIASLFHRILRKPMTIDVLRSAVTAALTRLPAVTAA